MKQLLNSASDPNWPNIEIDYHKHVELFVDSFTGYNPSDNTFKILWVKEAEEISKFKKSAIEHHKKFDVILTYDEEILRVCDNSYFIDYSFTWIDVEKFDVNIEKKFKISNVVGFKETTAGHMLRKEIYYNQDKIINPKDFYISKHGGVENIFNNKILGDTKNEMFDSQFHICIENTRQTNCFSEKIIDCFITKTIPIYWGCDNIENFFDINGIFVANNFKDVITISNSINDKTYEEKTEYVNRNYEISKKYLNPNKIIENTINEILKNFKK